MTLEVVHEQKGDEGVNYCSRYQAADHDYLQIGMYVRNERTIQTVSGLAGLSYYEKYDDLPVWLWSPVVQPNWPWKHKEKQMLVS